MVDFSRSERQQVVRTTAHESEGAGERLQAVRGVAIDAIRVHGSGDTRDAPVERRDRRAGSTRTPEGASETQRSVVEGLL